MRNIAGIAVFALLASAAVPAAAADDSQQKERMVCKTKAKTGTRFPTKTCRTAKQWAEIEEENKRAAAEQMNRPMIETRRDQ